MTDFQTADGCKKIVGLALCGNSALGDQVDELGHGYRNVVAGAFEELALMRSIVTDKTTGGADLFDVGADVERAYPLEEVRALTAEAINEALEAHAQHDARALRRAADYLLRLKEGAQCGLGKVLARIDAREFRPNELTVMPKHRLSASVADLKQVILWGEETEKVCREEVYPRVPVRIGLNDLGALVHLGDELFFEVAENFAMGANE